MLFIIQFPLADSRLFVQENTMRLVRPTWPSPTPDREFIRCWGGIKKRKTGGLNGWIGEDTFCEATKAIIFTQNILFTDSQSSLKIPFKVVFSRFYFDGNAVGKLELGFACPTKDRGREIEDNINEKQFKELINYLLIFKIKISNPLLNKRKEECELIKAGKFIARSYLGTTTIQKNVCDILEKKWLVEAGTPTILLICGKKISHKFPFFKKESDSKIFNGNIFMSLIPHQGSTYPMWVLEGVSSEFEQVDCFCNLRHLRICLLRLHAEHQCLRIILKNIESGKITISRDSEASQQLQYYLNEATSRINRLQSPNIDIAEIAREIQDCVSPGERENLIKYLEKTQVRKNIRRKVDNYLKSCYNSLFIGTMQGDIEIMEGDVIRDIGAGATVINRSLVEKSFNKVRDQFDENAASALRLIAQEIEKSGNKEAGELFDSFNEELQKPEPKRSLLRTLWNGMVEALPAIGQLAGVVAQISKLFIAA